MMNRAPTMNTVGNGRSSFAALHRIPVCQQRRTLRPKASYDHPALYSDEVLFHESSYWDKAFRDDPRPFEWYQSYRTLRPLILRYLPQDDKVLQVGMGTSEVQLNMVRDDGYEHIVSVDYSKEAVHLMQQAHSGVPQLVYMEGDARKLHRLPLQPESFAGVLDKGTMDALICGQRDTEDSAEMLQEIWRLLKPGAFYVQLTHAQPASRLRYLTNLQGGPTWQRVEVAELGYAGAIHGPQSVTGQEDASALPVRCESYSHWFYACQKP